MVKRIHGIILGIGLLIATAAVAGTVITGDITYSGNIAFDQPVTLSGGSTNTGASTAARFIPTGSTIPANGMYLPATNTVGFAANSLLGFAVNTAVGGTRYITVTPSSSNPILSVSAGSLNIVPVTVFDATVAAQSITLSTAVPATATSRSILGFTGGASQWYSFGADASTNGTFSMIAQRSDGTSPLTILSTSSAGVTTFPNAVTLSSGTTTFTSAGNTAQVIQNSAAGADLKNWTFGIATADLRLNAFSDNFGASTLAYSIARGTTYNVAAHRFYTSTAAGTPVMGFEVLATNGANHVTVQSATAPAISTSAGNLTVGSVGGATTLSDAILTVTAATPVLTNLGTDATLTTRTVCQDTTSKSIYFGSGAAGICLGTSSMRYKHDIAKLNAGLDVVRELRPVSFVYNKGYGDEGARKQVGLLAEDVARVMPAMVDNDKAGRPNAVDYGALFPILINAVKELAAANDNLQQEVETLKRKVH